MKKIKIFSIALFLFCVSFSAFSDEEYYYEFRLSSIEKKFDEMISDLEKVLKGKFRYSDKVYEEYKTSDGKTSTTRAYSKETAYFDTKKIPFDDLVCTLETCSDSSSNIFPFVIHRPIFMVKDFDGNEIKIEKTEKVKRYDCDSHYKVNCTKQKVTYNRYENIDFGSKVFFAFDFSYPKFSNAELEPLNNIIQELIKEIFSDFNEFEEQEFQEFPESYDQHFTRRQIYLKKIYENSRYISLIFGMYSDALGSAHGWSDNFSICYDKQKKKVVNFKEYFEDNYLLPASEENIEKKLAKIYDEYCENKKYYVENTILEFQKNDEEFVEYYFELFYIDYEGDLQIVPPNSNDSHHFIFAFPEDKSEL